jgi:hypothetical protein
MIKLIKATEDKIRFACVIMADLFGWLSPVDRRIIEIYKTERNRKLSKTDLDLLKVREIISEWELMDLSKVREIIKEWQSIERSQEKLYLRLHHLIERHPQTEARKAAEFWDDVRTQENQHHQTATDLRDSRQLAGKPVQISQGTLDEYRKHLNTTKRILSKSEKHLDKMQVTFEEAFDIGIEAELAEYHLCQAMVTLIREVDDAREVPSSVVYNDFERFCSTMEENLNDHLETMIEGATEFNPDSEVTQRLSHLKE